MIRNCAWFRRFWGHETWRRRFWEHAIQGDTDYAALMDYVHFNTVKDGLVTIPAEWPYWMFRACVERGLCPPSWIGEDRDLAGGEPGEWRHPAE